MYIWDVTNPSRDGDLEGGIIVHEYMHGISTRLTGGPANSNCLGFGEAGGMGEGWGDFFATILRHTSNTTRDDVYGMGEWVAGGKGIRKFSYSTDLKINPSTYSYVNKPAYFGVHAKGEVWAVILYEVYWNVVEKYGFTQDWFGNSDTYVNLATGVQEKSNKSTETFGNRLMMKIVILGMKLQPCNPTFVTARDAIIEAFVQEEPEGDVCLLWKGFAKRGLGYEAKSGFGGKESFKLPSTCV